jgi:hypothetical protein
VTKRTSAIDQFLRQRRAARPGVGLGQEGHSMTRVDKTLFYCIGAQKAGTTWLYNQLSGRPDFHIPMKEVHYFDAVTNNAEWEALFRRRLDDLRKTTAEITSPTDPGSRQKIVRLFNSASVLEMCSSVQVDDSKYLHFMTRGAAFKPAVGDITPAYSILSRDEYSRMAALSQNSRFLFMLRMDMNKGSIDDAGFEKACIDRLSLTIGQGPLNGAHRCNYVRTFEELEAVVPSENRMYVFHEDMFSDDWIASLCRFIGTGNFKANLEKRFLAGRNLPFPQALFRQTYAWLAEQYDYVATRFGAALPDLWRDRMTTGLS